MKLFIILFLFILLSQLNFADPEARGELIFQYKSGFSGTFNLDVSTSTYCWDFVNSSIVFIPEYTRTKKNLTSTNFDAPMSKNDGLDNIVWGSMNFTITNLPPNSFTFSFTLDLRDERWSTSDIYSSHDTRIEIDPIEMKVYISWEGESIVIINGSTRSIWNIWNAGPPERDNFKIPVILKNRMEGGPSTDFGTLWANNKQINSGSTDNFPFFTAGTVQHYTTETNYNGERKYSFKWIPNRVIPSSDQVFSSNFDFSIPYNTFSKDITRNFRTVFPLTIKNNMIELNSSISAGNILFKDPTTDNQFQSYSTSSNGYVENEAFVNLSEDIGNLQDQKYSLKAVSNFPYNNRNYYWYSGDFNPNSGTDILISEPTTKTANYKGTQLSNNAAAFSNNSQRRLIETKSGGITWLHQVYTSLGHVWIEHSSNGGTSWVLGNNGQPLDGTAGGKNPSIAFTNTQGYDFNYIGVVWQQPYDSKYKIMGKMFNQDIVTSTVPDPVTYIKTLHTEPLDAYSINANPNLILNGGPLQPYFITFERKSTSGSWLPGINWLIGNIEVLNGGQQAGAFGWVENWGKINGTDANTTNVQISLDLNYTGTSVNLIRQQGSPSGSIYSHKIYFVKCGTECWQYFQMDDGMISYPYVNTNPSIVSVPLRDYSACWIEYADLLAYRYYGSSVINYFGDNVQSCSINRGGGSSNSGFFVWSQNPSSIWTNKSVRFGENGVPVTSSIKTLNTTGKYVQVGNSTASSGTSSMYVSSFYPFSAPYYFKTASSPLTKENTELVTGRGFNIINGDASFNYCFSELNIDGKNISFIDAPDELDYGKIEMLNNVLITEPFRINENSKIVFSERSGFADSSAAVRKLGKDGFINFKLELIDEANGKVLVPVKTVNINSSSAYSDKTPSYLLDVKGFTGKTVRIKISLGTNLIEEFSPQLVVGDSANIPVHIKNRLERKYSNLVLTKRFSETNESLNKSSLDGLEVLDLDIPNTYALDQNYPNPFNPATVINYQIPKDGFVTLKIYDILGKEVRTLVTEQKSVGRYEIEFDASDLASGVYIYKLQVNDYTSFKKMMLIK